MMATPERLEFAESVPHPGTQFAPDCVSVQVTPLFCASFWTMAANFCQPIPACTEAEVNDSETCMGGGGVLTVPEFEYVLRLPAASPARTR